MTEDYDRSLLDHPSARPAPRGCVVVPVAGRAVSVRRHGLAGWQLVVDLRDEAEAASVEREIMLARLGQRDARP